MPSYPLRALVLRKTKLGETDLILTLLAADGGQVRAVAKGARKPKSRLGARTEPFTVLDLLLHSGRNLEIVAEAETLASHDAIRSDYDRCTAASVVADVLDKISVEGQTEPQLFEMALVTLDVMETAPVDTLDLLVVAFLLKALAMQGYRPSLDVCAACGEAPGEEQRFSVEAGGILCGRCADGSGGVALSSGARALMRALMRARMSEVPDADAPPAVRTEALRVVRAYVGFHVPARLRALDAYAVRS
jgi:DNA repair protein RecO (recombination protein O)